MLYNVVVIGVIYSLSLSIQYYQNFKYYSVKCKIIYACAFLRKDYV